MAVLIFVLLVFVGATTADINFHSPRGSNNRLDETTRNRKNANRLFDSQNNNRGGHNVGSRPNSMFYYGGSKLRIEWAVQHSCADENANCDMVLQYMCGDNVRDGTMAITPPSNRSACVDNDCDTDFRIGHHESFRYYRECASRERNAGLFAADQNPRPSARSTRQNRKGTRRGYECPEERDYYPYWWPSPWKDIAIFTMDTSRCHYLQKESENSKGRYYCYLPEEYWESKFDNDIVLFLSKEKCERAVFDSRGRRYKGEWRLKRSHGIDPPDCLQAQWSRDNHQGNTIGGEFLSYDWTVPNINSEHCVLRIRYNISTNDFDQMNTFSQSNGYPGPQDIWENFEMPSSEAIRRNYYFKGNPNLDIFDTNKKSDKKTFRLRLAIDTSKYGRTFQDRTHAFGIRQSPQELKGATIYNVNVRGKRGNIIQNYPSVPYDFVPNKLLVKNTDYIHFQWTGSNTNNLMNDGQGQKGTDRNNVVQINKRAFPGESNSTLSLATNYPSDDPDFLGLGWKEIDKLAHLSPCEGEDPLLDTKSAYFNMGPVLASKIGSYYYMSSRNNIFSHVTQKASIHVGDSCYSASDKGSEYRGYISVTRSGRQCEYWGDDSGYQKYYNPNRFPNDGLEGNFCRNPNPNSRSRPWCYVKGYVWEYCNVISCRNLKRQDYGKIQRDEENNDDLVLMEDEEDMDMYSDTDFDKPNEDEEEILKKNSYPRLKDMMKFNFK